MNISYSIESTKILVTYKTKAGEPKEKECKNIERAYVLFLELKGCGATDIEIQEIRKIIYND